MTRSPGAADSLGLLGLARRAGAVVTGVDATRRALQREGVALVLLARDASRTQLDKVTGILEHREIPVRWMPDQKTLGRPLGVEKLSVVGVTNRSFAEQLLRRLPSDSRTGPSTGTARETKEEPRRNAGS